MNFAGPPFTRGISVNEFDVVLVDAVVMDDAAGDSGTCKISGIFFCERYDEIFACEGKYINQSLNKVKELNVDWGSKCGLVFFFYNYRNYFQF